jgi:predicted RND superfamily exporter protein
MGLNSFAPDVSFITQAVSSVLQLAVSMDYAIFLLHRFGEYRAEGIEPKEAMRRAIVKSFAPVNASALTTLFGFLALIFMRFGIGKDLGTRTCTRCSGQSPYRLSVVACARAVELQID